jgi:hypothetical protein
MRRLRWLSLLLAVLFLTGIVVPALAQSNYSFQVPTETVNLYVNSDGTTTLEYSWVFSNDSGAHPIDYVDVGLPNSNYDFNSITASVNGTPISDIETTDNGITLGLGNLTIPAGSQGTVQMRVGTINGMLYTAQAQNSVNYAGFQFSPNWFSSDYAHGSTNLTFTVFLPSGMTSTDPRYFNPQNWPGTTDPTESGFDSQNRVYFRWQSSNANAYDQYTFGASFPAKLVPSDAVSTPPLFNIDWASILPCICVGGFFAFFVFIIVISIISSRKRRLQYLPPKISIEGHGIKRGLTAVEAGILLEEPLDKILTMILFSVVKKNAATVTTKEPLALTLTDPLPEGLYPYETDFLHAFANPNIAEQRSALQDMMVNLVKSVSEKMKGFSRKETVAFYQDIINRAWQEVEAAQTPDVKSQKFDEVMDWTMLDHNYNQRTSTVFGAYPIFLPMWWGRYDPAYRGASFGGVSSASTPHLSQGHTSGPAVNLPTLPGAAFAASVTGSVQHFSNNVLGNLSSFTSGVTNKTNPVPVAPPSSYHGGGLGGGGGHACACACACAGCACACAGGGR